MKKHILLFAIAAALAACNNTVDKAKADAKEPDAQVAAASDTKMDYAYTIEHPDNWVTGSRENTKMVLQSLKDYENGNFTAALTPFADSIKLSFDYVNGMFTKDSALKMFTQERSKIKSLKIDMEDFESVKSRDGKEEYVSLWYNQKWEDLKGTWDSLVVMDDLKIKDGKIIGIDEKIRHAPRKK